MLRGHLPFGINQPKHPRGSTQNPIMPQLAAADVRHFSKVLGSGQVCDDAQCFFKRRVRRVRPTLSRAFRNDVRTPNHVYGI
jgi:hypothetical protein